MVNPNRIEHITNKLKEVGSCWAVSNKKYVGTNEGYDAQPSYHIHPDSSRPRQEDIYIFYNLDDLESWVAMKKKAINAKTDDEANNIMLDWVLKGNRNERRRSYNRK